MIFPLLGKTQSCNTASPNTATRTATLLFNEGAMVAMPRVDKLGEEQTDRNGPLPKVPRNAHRSFGRRVKVKPRETP